MTRELSHKDPRALREETGDGLQICCRRINTSRLLDEIDAAQSVDDLRRLLSQFVTVVTGVK